MSGDANQNGGGGQPPSLEMRLAAKAHDRAQIDGARQELTQMRRGIDTRITQLTDASAQLGHECDVLLAELKNSRARKFSILGTPLPHAPEM